MTTYLTIDGKTAIHRFDEPPFFFAYCVTNFELLRPTQLRFHLPNHLCQLHLTFIQTARIHIPRHFLPVHPWRVPSFPRRLADLRDTSRPGFPADALVRFKVGLYRLWSDKGIHILILPNLVLCGHTAPERPINLLCCIPLHFIRHMGVYIQRCFHRCMSDGGGESL